MAARAGERGYVPYAEKFGVWQRGMDQFKDPLEKVWKPYLNGNGTRDEVLAALVRLVATDPQKKPKSWTLSLRHQKQQSQLLDKTLNGITNYS